MSIQDAITLIVRATDNEALAETITELDGEALVRRGEEMGLSFTVEELEAVAESPDVDPTSTQAELTEEQLGLVSGGQDVWGVIQWTMKQSYMECQEDLKMYADKVKFFNSQKKAIRNQLSRLRSSR